MFLFHAPVEPRNLSISSKKALAVPPRPSGNDPYGNPWVLVGSYLYLKVQEWVSSKWVRKSNDEVVYYVFDDDDDFVAFKANETDVDIIDIFD